MERVNRRTSSWLARLWQRVRPRTIATLWLLAFFAALPVLAVAFAIVEKAAAETRGYEWGEM